MHTGAEEESRAKLVVGKAARITLKGGHVETGEIVSLSAEAITIGNPSNYGFQKTAIPVESIETVEVQQDGKTESTIKGVLLIGAGAAAAFFLLMGHALSGLGTT